MPVTTWTHWLRTLRDPNRPVRGAANPHRRLCLDALEDRTTPATFTVTTTSDSGVGSLRQAILDANNVLLSPGLDTIQFALGAGAPLIAVPTALPTITDPVVIDGATGGATRVELRGPERPATIVSNGLHVVAGGSTINAMVNAGVRHTFVFLHHPLWTARDLTLDGWLEFEQMMAGRKHHVYCGHVHNYRKFLRNGTAYYQLPATGGGSALRGVEYGEFDQLAWVTMKKVGPVMANVLLNGLYSDDLRADETHEDGSVLPAVGLPLVTGTVTPAYGTNVIYTLIPEPKKADEPKADEPKKENPADVPVAAPAPVTGSSRIGSDGRYTIYGNRGTAGLRPGRYAVTFAPSENLIIDAAAAKPDNPVPEKYRTLSATPFRVEVTKDGVNKFDLALE